MAYYDKYKVSVPPGTVGPWSVDRFTVGKDDSKLTVIFATNRGRGYVPEGTYTRLTKGRTVVMSDTPDEVSDHMSFIHSASGDVLIAGLGIGVVLQACLRNERVKRITVVEKSPDVIALVADHYLSMPEADSRLEIVNADIFTWKPPKDQRWDHAWFDIWNTICTDNRLEMQRLRRKFGRRCPKKHCWCEHYIERLYKQEQRNWRYI